MKFKLEKINILFHIYSVIIMKKKCAIIGCSGMAGQQFIESLQNHPWFEITGLFGSSRTGKSYKDILRYTDIKFTQNIEEMQVKKMDAFQADEFDVAFSAVPSEAAAEIETSIAHKIPVISTASYYRYFEDVPIFLPIVNAKHVDLFKIQQENRNWNGFVCPGPNCTTVGLSISLYPIYRKFGLASVHMVSMQAVSGAGYDGVTSYEILGNIIPHIPKEEEKVQKELKKIFATYINGKLNLPDFPIDAKCNRVPVLHGHTQSIFFQTQKETTMEAIQKELSEFQSETKEFNLLNCPKHPICLFSEKEPFRPQPRLELKHPESGMITFVGGLEKTDHPNGFKMTVLSHNTQVGAGRGGVLSAEFLLKKGLI
ncbi:MAG: aspartate-semialdehyde dehydrogenase [Promethearchaeota archaeon]|nr:MAG: aspartate-semialdehyde dehydrogenase [Candidatus Lokiarchaeota archaeon]